MVYIARVMHECLDCGYVYVPSDGVPSAGVSRGTPFDGLPGSFRCPACGAALERFEPVQGSAMTGPDGRGTSQTQRG